MIAATKQHELTSEEIERNNILTGWFNHKEVKNGLNYIGYLHRHQYEMRLLQDSKQEVFLDLLSKPIEFIRNKNEDGSWKMYIYNCFVMNSKEKDRFFKTFIEPTRGNVEHEYLLDHQVPTTEAVDAFDKADLFDNCINEIDRLPYLERESILLYAHLGSIIGVEAALRESGHKLDRARISKTLSATREKIQNNLLQKEVIQKKVSFISLSTHGNKYDPSKTSGQRIAKDILKLIELVDKQYSCEWCLADKALYAFMKYENPATVRAITSFIMENYDTDILKENGRKGYSDALNLSPFIAYFINSGTLKKRSVSGRSIIKEYFFPNSLLSYIKSLKATNESAYDSSIMWRIYIDKEGNKMLFKNIAGKFGITEQQAECHFQKAKKIIDALLNEKQSAQWN